MKKLLILLLLAALLFTLAACKGRAEDGSLSEAMPEEGESDMDENTADADVAENNGAANGGMANDGAAKAKLQMKIGDTAVSVRWEDNESVAALAELVKDEPLLVQMSGYGGFEQVGSLGTELPRNDVQTTTKAGDIVLYSGNQIVVFYGTNDWAYTRLGRVADKSEAEMAELLGNGDVTVSLSAE